jgi:multiple sugar transport system permease protein
VVVGLRRSGRPDYPSSGWILDEVHRLAWGRGRRGAARRAAAALPLKGTEQTVADAGSGTALRMAEVGVSGRAGSVASRPRRWKNLRTPYGFLAPFLVFLAFFGILPIGYALYLSLTDTSGDPAGTGVIGNYTLGDEDFRFAPAVGHVGLYLVMWLPTLIVVVFVAAFLLEARPGRISTVLRVVFYIPGSLAGSAAVLVWLFMFDPGVSPFRPVYHLLGLTQVNQVITGNFVAVAIAVMALSTGAGGWIVIIYGALRNLPHDIIEAAQLDGCGGLRIAMSVKFPQVRRYVVLIAILSFATGTQVFVEPSLLFSAGIGFVSPTWSINQLGYYYAFTYGRFGVSAALSFELFLVSLVLALIVIFRTNFFARTVHA